MMKAVLKKARKFISRLSLASQIAIFALALSLFFPLVSGVLNQQVYGEIFLSQTYDSLNGTLALVDNNMENTIALIDETSKALIANEEVREVLSYGRFTDNIEQRNRSRDFIRNVLDNTSYTSSVHLFNTYGSVMDIGISMIVYPVSDNIKDALWYQEITSLKGQYKLIPNGGEFFESDSEEAYISMARAYMDIDTQKEKGTLVINVSTSSLEDAFSALVSENNTTIKVADVDGTVLVNNGSSDDALNIIKDIKNSDKGYVLSVIDEVTYMTTYRESSHGWYIIGSLDTQDVTAGLNQTYNINLFFLFLTGILIFVGISVFVKYRTDVIKHIVKTMNDTSSGRLEKSLIKSNSSDIKNLKNGYNSMVDKIDELIEQVRNDEENKSQLEFNALQSQIKPHFLYNTFDSISSLALMGESQLVYEASMALGSFYRISLSRGKEIITLAEEVEAIKSYLKILSIRYGEIFSVEWAVDEAANEMSIPKLLLQPFVENAIYHGIRPKGEPGVLSISIDVVEEKVNIRIEDDGMGMDQSLVDRLRNKESGGFGFQSTVQRLEIYYKDNATLNIQSEKGNGTVIDIMIPYR